ncbi:MAG TPA: hypothetical protein PKO18_01250 [Chitinophagales bacterium]|nr:hypothetical protein [Chitinophagales bacterium]HNL83829.1 hypothetical protein [Chitinophagales bacterium]
MPTLKIIIQVFFQIAIFSIYSLSRSQTISNQIERFGELQIDLDSISDYNIVRLDSTQDIKYLSITATNNSLSQDSINLSPFKNLVYLKIDGYKLINLKRLFLMLKNNKKLQVLILNNNCIESIPSNIQSLKNLTFLDLNWNSISSLPRNLKKLSSLNTLILGSYKTTHSPSKLSNKFQDVPKVVLKLKKLNTFIITNNKLQKINKKMIDKLKKIKHLGILNGNYFEDPNSIKSELEKYNIEIW